MFLMAKEDSSTGAITAQKVICEGAMAAVGVRPPCGLRGFFALARLAFSILLSCLWMSFNQVSTCDTAHNASSIADESQLPVRRHGTRGVQH